VKQIKFAGLTVTKIFVLRGTGTDKISFTCDGAPTTFPESKYPPCFNVETRHGYAEEWLKIFDIEMNDERVEFLDSTRQRMPFSAK
jgi:hypothetical protein